MLTARFFFQAEAGIRDGHVTGVQTCALPISGQPVERVFEDSLHDRWYTAAEALDYGFIDAIVDRFEQVAPRGRAVPTGFALRSEERRVGKESRSRGPQQRYVTYECLSREYCV